MNYYERYCGDYGRDTTHLTLAEHGTYSVLLDVYYSTERPLPNEYRDLYRICRALTKAEHAAVRSVADQFFPIGDDGLRHNYRADREIAKARIRITSARVNGSHGGRPPKNPLGSEIKTQSKPNGLENGNPLGYPAETQPGKALPDPTRHTPRIKINNTMSGSPKNPANADAIRLLEFLNQKTGRKFRPTAQTLKPILARLKENTFDECRAVIVQRWVRWGNDDKMRDYLRPDTLFGATKFAQYIGDVPTPEEMAEIDKENGQ